MIDRKKAIPAPDFTAVNSEGVLVRLSAYQGEKNVVLAFKRGFT